MALISCSDWVRCPMCDEWYDPFGERASIHDHPEPQSGKYRDAWLDSGLSYDRWITDTALGKEWDTIRLDPNAIENFFYKHIDG